MQAAARVGVSHTEFLSWPHRDRALLIALGRVEKNTGRYGEWLPDATSDKADLNYYEPDMLRFAVQGPFTNHAEKMALDAEKQYRKEAGEKANLNGMFWTVESVDPALQRVDDRFGGEPDSSSQDQGQEQSPS